MTLYNNNNFKLLGESEDVPIAVEIEVAVPYPVMG
jgi:hypothetical protein